MNWEKIIKIYAEKYYLDDAAARKEIRDGWVSKEELFEAWLEYEGIIGYASEILNVLDIIDKLTQ